MFTSHLFFDDFEYSSIEKVIATTVLLIDS